MVDHNNSNDGGQPVDQYRDESGQDDPLRELAEILSGTPLNEPVQANDPVQDDFEKLLQDVPESLDASSDLASAVTAPQSEAEFVPEQPAVTGSPDSPPSVPQDSLEDDLMAELGLAEAPDSVDEAENLASASNEALSEEVPAPGFSHAQSPEQFQTQADEFDQADFVEDEDGFEASLEAELAGGIEDSPLDPAQDHVEIEYANAQADLEDLPTYASTEGANPELAKLPAGNDSLNATIPSTADLADELEDQVDFSSQLEDELVFPEEELAEEELVKQEPDWAVNTSLEQSLSGRQLDEMLQDASPVNVQNDLQDNIGVESIESEPTGSLSPEPIHEEPHTDLETSDFAPTEHFTKDGLEADPQLADDGDDEFNLENLDIGQMGAALAATAAVAGTHEAFAGDNADDSNSNVANVDFAAAESELTNDLATDLDELEIGEDEFLQAIDNEIVQDEALGEENVEAAAEVATSSPLDILESFADNDIDNSIAGDAEVENQHYLTEEKGADLANAIDMSAPQDDSFDIDLGAAYEAALVENDVGSSIDSDDLLFDGELDIEPSDLEIPEEQEAIAEFPNMPNNVAAIDPFVEENQSEPAPAQYSDALDNEFESAFADELDFGNDEPDFGSVSEPEIAQDPFGDMQNDFLGNQQPAPSAIPVNNDPVIDEISPPFVDDLTADSEFAGAAVATAAQASSSEELHSQSGRGGGFKAAGIALGLALFAGLGFVGYGMIQDDGATAPTIIKADQGPIKVKPENPGGKDVANKDKATYENVDGKTVGKGQESLTKAAEVPIDVASQAKSDDRLAAGTGKEEKPGINLAPRKVKTLTVKPDGTILGDPASALTQEDTKVAKLESTPADSDAAATEEVKTDAGNNTQEVTYAPPSAKPTPRPKITNSVKPRTVNTVKVKPQPAPKKAAPVKTANAPIQIAPAGGNSPWSVQVSSQRSEADARAAYQKMKGRFGSVLANQPVQIQRAAVEGKGVYYRVRIPANSKQDAASLCNRLKSAGGSCFIAR